MITYITGRSHSASRSLHYIYYGKYNQHHGKLNEAHPNPNRVTKRNELISGIDCRTDDYERLLKEWDFYLNKKPKGQLQALNVVLSFKKSDFNFSNPADVVDAVHIGRDFVYRAFPNHQAVIAAQHDNKNGIPHIHICVSQVDERSLKAINGKYSNFWRLKRISNQALTDYEYDTGRSMKHNYDYTRKKFTYQHHLKPTTYEQMLLEKLVPIVQDQSITSKAKFRKACRSVGIRSRFSRAGSQRRRWSRSSRNGRRKRSGLSFKMNGHTYVRSSQLAKFNPSVSLIGVHQIISSNKQKQQQEAEARRLMYRKSIASQSAMVRARVSQQASISTARSMFVSASLSQSISYSVRSSYSASQSTSVSASKSLSVSTLAGLSQSALIQSRESLSVARSRASVSASISMSKSQMANKYTNSVSQFYKSTSISQPTSEGGLHSKEDYNNEEHIQNQKDVDPTNSAINQAKRSLKRPARHPSPELFKIVSSARQRLRQRFQETSSTIQSTAERIKSTKSGQQKSKRRFNANHQWFQIVGVNINELAKGSQRVYQAVQRRAEKIPKSIDKHIRSLQKRIQRTAKTAQKYVHIITHPREHHQHLQEIRQQRLRQQQEAEEAERKRQERNQKIRIARERNQGPTL